MALDQGRCARLASAAASRPRPLRWRRPQQHQTQSARTLEPVVAWLPSHPQTRPAADKPNGRAEQASRRFRSGRQGNGVGAVAGLRCRSLSRFGRTAFNRRLAVDSLDERHQLLGRSLKPAYGRWSSGCGAGFTLSITAAAAESILLMPWCCAQAPKANRMPPPSARLRPGRPGRGRGCPTACRPKRRSAASAAAARPVQADCHPPSKLRFEVVGPGAPPGWPLSRTPPRASKPGQQPSRAGRRAAPGRLSRSAIPAPRRTASPRSGTGRVPRRRPPSWPPPMLLGGQVRLDRFTRAPIPWALDLVAA